MSIVSDEAIDAAARAEWEFRCRLFSNPPDTPEMEPWDELDEGTKGVVREFVRNTAEAIAPHIADDLVAGEREACAKLRADLMREALDHDVCEGCGAPLFPDDKYVAGEDCSGCWHTMTDQDAPDGYPCYAYRVGKPDAAIRARRTKENA